jgi:hypothetical protein
VTFTYERGTDLYRVRRTIPDRVQAEAIFDDDEIESFIEDEGDWRRATALALETIAADEALVQKVMQTQEGLRTDGAKTADALLKRAAMLRDQAVDAEAVDEGGMFDVAEMVTGPFSYRERIHNEALRHG